MPANKVVLIVDDMEVNRTILSVLFSDSYGIMEADNGTDALSLIREHWDSIAVVLLDIVMPGKSGYEVLESLQQERLLERIPVIVVTSESSSEGEIRSFDLGASDLITKPFEPHVVKRRVNNIIDLYRHKNELEQLVAVQAHKLQSSNEAMIDALSSVIEYRNLESGQHIRRIRMFTKILLQRVMQSKNNRYNWNQKTVNIIASAASMHDIGKIIIPDSILNKPGKLTREEFEIMKTHSEKGSELIRDIVWLDDKDYLEYAYKICRYHHERWDGKGYPEGLKGEEIPACALIVGVADVYDALTSPRVYKPAFPPEIAVRMIINGECGVFPDWLLDCFRDVEDVFAELVIEYSDSAAAASGDVG